MINFIGALISLATMKKKKWQQQPDRTVYLKPVSKIQEHICVTALFIRQTQFCNFPHCSQPALKLVFQTYEVIVIITADVTVTKIFAFEIG